MWDQEHVDAELLEIIQKLQVHTILEVGCGTGLVLGVLKLFFKALGVDFSKERLKISKNFGEVILADASFLPFKSETFDVVLTKTTLMHIPSWHILKTLKELKRVTKRYIVCEEFYDPHKITPLALHCFNHNYPEISRKLHLSTMKTKYLNKHYIMVFSK